MADEFMAMAHVEALDQAVLGKGSNAIRCLAVPINRTHLD
jgi:hypothetical protein